MVEMEAIMILSEIKHGSGNGTEQVPLVEVDVFRGGEHVVVVVVVVVIVDVIVLCFTV